MLLPSNIYKLSIWGMEIHPSYLMKIQNINLMKKIRFTTSLLVFFLFLCSIQFSTAQNEYDPLHHIIFHVIRAPQCPPYPTSFDLELKIEAANIDISTDCPPFRIAVYVPIIQSYLEVSELIHISPDEWVEDYTCDDQTIYYKELVIPLNFSILPCEPGQDHNYRAIELQIVEEFPDPTNSYFPFYDDANCLVNLFPVSCFYHSGALSETIIICHACDDDNGGPPDIVSDTPTGWPGQQQKPLINSSSPNYVSNNRNIGEQPELNSGQGVSNTKTIPNHEDTRVYPNPFNDKLMVEYHIENPTSIQLLIRDLNASWISYKQLNASWI